MKAAVLRKAGEPLTIEEVEIESATRKRWAAASPMRRQRCGRRTDSP